MHILKTVLQGAQRNTSSDKTLITDTNNIYLDQAFSTWVPLLAITYCLRETADNKAECNVAWGMFAISRFIESFKSDKVCQLHVQTEFDTSQKSIRLRSGDHGDHEKEKWPEMMQAPKCCRNTLRYRLLQRETSTDRIF